MLHIDIPTLAEFKALAAIKGDTCVSLYVPTSPLPDQASKNRIMLEDLASDALSQLKEAGTDKRRVETLEEQFPVLPVPTKTIPTTTRSESFRTASRIRSTSSGNSRDMGLRCSRRRR